MPENMEAFRVCTSGKYSLADSCCLAPFYRLRCLSFSKLVPLLSGAKIL